MVNKNTTTGQSQKPKSIQTYGRRWTDMYGNTYHSVEVFVNFGSPITVANTVKFSDNFTYGYGNQYEYTALELLKNNGILPIVIKRAQENWTPIWKLMKQQNIKYSTFVQDVKRKKDL
jgi:hypothetical protein